MTSAATTQIDGAATKTSTGVRLQGLVKSYRGPQGPIRAVRGIDFSIVAGETAALLGPNGAGKSTTIDMILGLSKPDDGTVSVFGRPPREAVDAGLVGAMLQTGGLIRDLSVRELVAMMASLYPDPIEVEEALEVTGLETIAGQRTQKLSGGQTQRVRFALAIVCNPDLLVLDEPTVALDVEGRREFWSIMRAFAARGKTVLFATHYLEEADVNADRAILMAHGRIVADGPTTEIKARVGRRTLRATLPGIDAVEPGGPAGRRLCRAPRRRGDPELHRLRPEHPGTARAISGREGHRDHRRNPRGGVPGADGRAGRRRAGAGGAMNGIAYTRFELLRTFRNRRFFLFSLGFPLVFFWLIAAPQHNKIISGTGLTYATYYMVSLASFGTMMSMISTGRADRRRAPGRVDPAAADQPAVGARVLPRQGADRIRNGAVEPARALHLGLAARRQPARRALAGDDRADHVGLLPFAALGVLVGHLVNTDSVGPLMGGLVSILAFLSGTWFAITSGFLHAFGQFLPSWWLVQARNVALDGHAWGARGWITVAAWTAILAAGAAWAYRRDTTRSDQRAHSPPGLERVPPAGAAKMGR